MDDERINRRRRALERSIRELVVDFEYETGEAVDGIFVKRRQPSKAKRRTLRIEVDVE